jgi:Malic enzyme
MSEFDKLIVRDPRRNKGTAFTIEERQKYGLIGLMPNVVETMETQIRRVHIQLDNFELPIQKYMYLTNLLDNNETLFFKTIISEPAKYLPLVYTPTVGEACERFGHIARQARALFISIEQKDNIKELLKNWPVKDVRFTVVTDGERILGLGDLGLCGIGIPIGKLILYTSCAGVPPEYTLPIVLDAGTNNETFLNDPLYPGLKKKRVSGKEFDDFVEAFVTAINEVFPKICIQWEDFAGKDAIRILEKYRDKVCTFNDDMQGTAAIATAGIITEAGFLVNHLVNSEFFFWSRRAAFGIAICLFTSFKKMALARKKLESCLDV